MSAERGTQAAGLDVQDGDPNPGSERSSTETNHNAKEQVASQEYAATRGASAPAAPQPAAGAAAPLSTAKTLLIMVGLVMAMFLVSLDRIIIGVAIPTITDRFHSFSDIAWYSSAYMLALACSQLIWARLYKNRPVKTLLLSSIGLFELGSVLCGAAPNSNCLIAGRAIAGLGAGGIFSGCIQVLVVLIPLDKRPTWIALFQMTFGLSSAIAPLLGGAFTTKVSWRWCFYINLPLGALAVVAVTLLYKDPTKPKRDLTLWQQFNEVDPIGVALLAPSMICLVLALQWGGTTYAWSSARIIVLFCFFGVLLFAFGVSQYSRQDAGLVPPRIFLHRAVLASASYTLLIAGSFTVGVYYLPIWFQVVKASSALESGYQTIPFALALSLFVIIAGRVTQMSGYYSPPILASLILGPIGIGLISTFDPHTAEGKWIGYQILWGAGIGLSIAGPNIAVQTALSRADNPLGIGIVLLSQQLGGAIFVPVAQNLLQNRLKTLLAGINGVNPATIANIGATELRNSVPPQELNAVVFGYNEALTSVWYLALALFCACLVPFVFIPILSIKKEAAKAAAAEKASKLDQTPATDSSSSPKVKDVEAAKS